jgi:hypothetical protein
MGAKIKRRTTKKGRETAKKRRRRRKAKKRRLKAKNRRLKAKMGTKKIFYSLWNVYIGLRLSLWIEIFEEIRY